MVLLDAVAGLVLLLGGIAIASMVFVQFRMAEKRGQREWIAHQELLNLAENFRSISFDSIEQAMQEQRISQETAKSSRILN